jgi:hypothetical protein
MDLANMLFGFFKTQDGNDEGAAGAATAPSACAIEKTLRRNGEVGGLRAHLQDSISSFLGNGGGEIAVRRSPGL